MIKNLVNKFSQYMIRRVARAHGFMDPVVLMSKLSRFAKPTEVAVPIEVMRIGMVLQARGAINSQAIQHNLDWIWPYWVTQQFDPKSPSFIPRAFALTHINLTHRNWTAVGLPGRMDLPIVDPRGLVTPFYDGWSIDAWIIDENGDHIIPSRMNDVNQQWDIQNNPKVITRASLNGHELKSCVQLYETVQGQAVCRINLQAKASGKAKLVISLRPYNPEGVSFINQIKKIGDDKGWVVNGESAVLLDQKPDQHYFSNYEQGDVYQQIFKEGSGKEKIQCDVGLATSAAVFSIEANQSRDVTVDIPLEKHADKKSYQIKDDADDQWARAVEGGANLTISDKKFQFLYNAAVRTLLLHTGEDVFPGPYTYKHFWFRDAAFMVYALLCAGIKEPCAQAIKLFFQRQRINGYFCSQDGEWDSNGQVLWALEKYYAMTGRQPDEQYKSKIKSAADWLMKKRVSKDHNSPHAGLLPAGFSAEHFGPNDFYYWDDFWAVAGFEAGSQLMKKFNEHQRSQHYQQQAEDMMVCIEKSLNHCQDRLSSLAMPSSVYRRLDSSAIGSLAVGYPLYQWEAHDKRTMQTVDFLLEQCFLKDGFFHDMSHSGINPYLTLYVAQVLMRAGDQRYVKAMKAIADLATSTGQWPEAVHPLTKGGCMGDGQHAWAAAEWVIMMRNCFVREEERAHELVLCQGVMPEWYADGEAFFGPALTSYGTISVVVKAHDHHVFVEWDADWYTDDHPQISIALPGFKECKVADDQNKIDLVPKQ